MLVLTLGLLYTVYDVIKFITQGLKWRSSSDEDGSSEGGIENNFNWLDDGILLGSEYVIVLVLLEVKH